MNRQGKNRIDYLDYTWNCVKGLCKRGCSYCFMQRYYKRFKLNPKIRLDEKELNRKFPKNSCKIGICFNHDLFGDWISSEWIYKIIKRTEENPQHTFIFLTKNPLRYNNFKFPKNCWLGTTVDGTINTIKNLKYIQSIEHFNLIKFVSFEPLIEITYLKEIDLDFFKKLDWMIVGADTNADAKKPPLMWCDGFRKLSRRLDIPLWIKDSFINMGYPRTIKEFPKR